MGQVGQFRHGMQMEIKSIMTCLRDGYVKINLSFIEDWAQDYGNSNIFLKPLFRGNLDPFVNNGNLGAVAHTSNGT